MRKLTFAVVIGIFCCVNFARAADSCNNHVIISQIYGGGGNNGATYKNDFIELYNPTTEDVSLNNWSVQYATKEGAFTNTTILSNSIKAKSYYLIAEAKGSGGTGELPISDKSGSINLSAADGKIALAKSTQQISDKNDINIVDFVGYGNANAYEGSATALSPGNTQSIARNKICLDSNDNYTDFEKINPSPLNSNIAEGDDEELPDGGESPGDMETTGGQIQNSSEKCATSSLNIKLSEIFPYPKSGDEFIEIVNTSEGCVDVSDWKIMDAAGHKKEFPANSIIDPGEYLSLQGNLYLNNDSDTVYLLDTNGNAKNDALDGKLYENAQSDFSYSLNGETWHWTSTPTPNSKNIIAISASEENNSTVTENNSNDNFSSAEKVYLNEILPHPKDDEEKEEFIEIVNQEKEPVDLFGWTIRDSSKTGKYIFKEHVEIKSGEYLAIYRPGSKLALNNSKESVSLFNPQGEITSTVSYEKSQKNSSYNFDGESWRWSKYLTPGEKNKFDSPPVVKIDKIKTAYKNLDTEFSAKAKDKETKKLKYAWDFGDGKKSYLAKTSHKYLDTGKYTATLAVSDDSQTIKKSFSLQVKNCPRPDLEIVKLVPNPAGPDTGVETIDIRNNSNKKIDLAGWKIATGSEKAYSHPITGKLNLEPGETKTLTHNISKFSLNNKAGIVKLVMPDGKVVDTVEYQKEKIAEDEAYEKIDGEWTWLAPGMEEGGVSQEEDTSDKEATAENSQETGEVLGASTDNIDTGAPELPNEKAYSAEDAFIFYSSLGFQDSLETNYCAKIAPINLSIILAQLV